MNAAVCIHVYVHLSLSLVWSVCQCVSSLLEQRIHNWVNLQAQGNKTARGLKILTLAILNFIAKRLSVKLPVDFRLYLFDFLYLL